MTEPMSGDVVVIPIEINLKAMLAPLYGQTYPDGEWDVVGPPDPVGFLQQQVVSGLIKEIATSDLRQKVAQVRDDLVRSLAAEMIAAELAKGVTVTDSYGEPKKQTSVAELIVDEVKRQLAYSTDTRRYDSKPTTLATLIKTQVEQVLAQELTEDLNSAKLTLRKAAREKAVEVMTAAVARAAGV